MRSKTISAILFVTMLFSMLTFNGGYCAEVNLLDEDTVIWQNELSGGTLSASSTDKATNGRFNKLLNVKATYETSNGETYANLLVDNTSGTAPKKATALRQWLAFEDDVSLGFKMKIKAPETGDYGAMSVSFGGSFMSLEYNEKTRKLDLSLGDEKYFVAVGEWIRVNAYFDMAEADNMAGKLSGARLKVLLMGDGLYSSNGEKLSYIESEFSHPVAYSESTWAASVPDFSVVYTVPAASSAAFCLSDCKVIAPADFQLTGMSAPTYADDENIDLNGAITVTFNHDIDVRSYSDSYVKIVDESGAEAKAEKIFNSENPDTVIFDFSENALFEYTDYSLWVDERLLDVYSKSLNRDSLVLSIETLGQAGATPTPMPISTPPAGGYVMPDEYNTGHISDFEDLKEFSQKYPDATGTVVSGNYLISDAVAKKYGYVFEGFKSEVGITVNANNVTIRDFYINGNSYWGIVSNGKNNVLEDGEIVGTSSEGFTGSGYTARRLKVHDVGADHAKSGDNVVIESCYFYDGGSNNPEAHADGIQFYNKTNSVKVLGCRFDMPPLPVEHMANACIFLSPNAGNVGNVQISYNWLNGGGFTSYIKHNGFDVTNITFTDNYFGEGRTYGYCNRTVEDATYENNVALNDLELLSAGSVLYADSEGNLISDLKDAAGKTVDVSVNFANYTTSERSYKMVINTYAGASLKQSSVREGSIRRYIPTDEYLVSENLKTYTYTASDGTQKQTSTLKTIPDLPRNVLETAQKIDISGSDRIEVLVYSISSDGSETLIRKDEILNSGADAFASLSETGVSYANVGEECKLIVACYSGGYMTQMKSADVCGSGFVSFEELEINTSGADRVCAMLWKDFLNIMPVCVSDTL